MKSNQIKDEIRSSVILVINCRIQINLTPEVNVQEFRSDGKSLDLS